MAYRRPKLLEIADEWIDRWNEKHRSVSLLKLFEQYQETRSQDSQKHQQVFEVHERENGQASYVARFQR